MSSWMRSAMQPVLRTLALAFRTQSIQGRRLIGTTAPPGPAPTAASAAHPPSPPPESLAASAGVVTQVGAAKARTVFVQLSGAPAWAKVTVSGTASVAHLTKEVAKELGMEKERLSTITLRVVTGKDSLSPQLDSMDTVEEALGPIKSGDKVRIVVTQSTAPRVTFFAAFQRYVEARIPAAQLAVHAAETELGRANASLCDRLLRADNIAAAEQRLTTAVGRLSWLQSAQAIRTHSPRAAMTTKPTWSFAGNLLKTARGIEGVVARTVPAPARGSKDHLPFVYVSNPPLHGKTLLLDNLFPDEAATRVCTLSATYNDAALLGREDLGPTAVGALRGLLLRLLNCLVFDKRNWGEIWEHSPLATAEEPVRVFMEMLGLKDASAPALPLLICIDEINKLIDDDACVWARKKDEQKAFWRGLYSLTRATQMSWVRVVMTGTGSKPEAVSALDISFFAFGLSMVTDPERSLLASELVWAYAVENTVPFPGFLWSLVKSTPGLLGLWASQINLHRHVKESCRCPASLVTDHPDGIKASVTLAMNPNDMFSNVGGPVKVLQQHANRNWPIIFRFLVEGGYRACTVTVAGKAALNAGLVTGLDGRLALSPFAVAVTVMHLRGRALPVDSAGSPIGLDVFRFLDGALQACSKHAGCADSLTSSWRAQVQRQLQRAVASVAASEILRADPRLAADGPCLPEPSVNIPGAAAVHSMEDFVLHAFALRLECLRLAARLDAGPGSSIPANELLPAAVGMIRRPPLLAGSGLAGRHEAERTVAVAVPTSENRHDFLAKLCTQTAALMLPTPVTMILEDVTPSSISSRLLEPVCQDEAPPLSEIYFSYDSVTVVDRDCPATFPVLVLDHPLLSRGGNRHGPMARQALLSALIAAAQTGDELDVPAFVATMLAATSVDLDLQVRRVVDSLRQTVALVVRAVASRQAILFKPTNLDNPLCGTVAIIPDGRAVHFLWIEAKDERPASIDSRLMMASEAELLIAPMAVALVRMGIAVGSSILVPVARAPFRID